jgi:two-component system KDP operon response regulator KdpE
LVLLDLALPDGSGIGMLGELRAIAMPTIVVSATDREDEKVTALDAGARDYVTKPFGTSELLARVRAALRGDGAPAVVTVGPLRIDHARREVSMHGSLVHLTPLEYEILATLARHAGKVVTHTQLVELVWGARATSQHQSLRVHMAALRKKLERDPARPRWLVTELGVGYRLRDA